MCITEAVNKFQEFNLNAFEMQWENSQPRKMYESKG